MRPKLRRVLALALALLVALLPAAASASDVGVLRPLDATSTYGPFPAAGVQIVGSRGGFLYVVQGAPQLIRGMGYNAPLSALSEDVRRTRFARDFALMRRVGVNTVLGWDQAGFDADLLNAAQDNGLGVIMHFELAKEWNYADPTVQQRLLDEIGQWIDTYRDHPAVRMWGIGNEVMLGMNPDECRAFADFYIQIYQTVRQHDPNHPIVYREAEDVRVPYFRDAFAAAGVAPSNFVFGMNFYTPRMNDALADFPEYQFDVPVLVSEFAPAGIAPSARAAGFEDLWNRVQKHERFVLGAAPYAWTIDGPEAVDRLFGLTDGQGHPVDGALAELQRLFRGRVSPQDALPAPTPPSRASLGMALDAAVAQALARAMALPDLDSIDVEAVRATSRDRYGRDLAAAPNVSHADQRLMGRMLDLLVDTSVLAALRHEGQPVYPGAVEALPLVAGMGRWAATDASAEAVAESFLTEVVSQSLRQPVAVAAAP